MTIMGIMAISLVGFLIFIGSTHKKNSQGKALVRTGFGGAKVALDSGMFSIPILHKIEEIDISMKTLKIKEQIRFLNEEFLELEIHFFVRINKDPRYVVEVAQTIGCEQAGKQEVIENLFHAKFTEAIRDIAAEFEANEVLKSSLKFKIQILQHIGTDLNGFILDDCAIQKIKKVPDSNFGEVVFVLLDSEKPLEKGEKLIVIDKTNDGKSYIVRQIQ